jgi:hypothetical protein
VRASSVFTVTRTVRIGDASAYLQAGLHVRQSVFVMD